MLGKVPSQALVQQMAGWCEWRGVRLSAVSPGLFPSVTWLYAGYVITTSFASLSAKWAQRWYSLQRWEKVRVGRDEGQCLWTWVHSLPHGLCLGSLSPLPWDLLGSGPSSPIEGLPQPLVSNSTQISSIIGFCAKGQTGKGVAVSRQNL